MFCDTQRGYEPRVGVSPDPGSAARLPLLLTSLTGRSGHGLARMGRIRTPTRSASG